jgi:hypothetical protein
VLALGGDEQLVDAARAYEDYVAGETLAMSVAHDLAEGEPAIIEGHPLRISVTKS